jgi:hypothetical protein
MHAMMMTMHFIYLTSMGCYKLGGALRVQYLAGLASFDEPERAGLNEHVWEVAGSEVLLFV